MKTNRKQIRVKTTLYPYCTLSIYLCKYVFEQRNRVMKVYKKRMVRPCCARGDIHFSFVLIQRKVTKEKSRAGVFGAIRIKPLAAGAKNSLRSNIRSFPAPGKILTYAPTPRPLAMRMVRLPSCIAGKRNKNICFNCLLGK